MSKPSVPRPTALPVSPDEIPVDLKALHQWVTWRYTWKPKLQKWDKPPLIARLGTPASSTNPDTWASFEAALDAYQHDQYDGIGVVVIQDNELAGIDLDHCRDLHTGAITPWAQAIVDRMHTYTEVSPSGTGLRLFLNGTRPKKGRRKGAIEIYSWGRYLTITGWHLNDTPTTIESRQAELEAFEAEVFSKPPPAKHPTPAPTNGRGPHLTDDELLSKALAARNGRKFARLWSGDTSDYGGDESRADLALCGELVFWTQAESQIDRLFRRSGLYRDKWERADYRDATIAKALASTTEHWNPPRKRTGAKPEVQETSRPAEDPIKPSLTLTEVVKVFQDWLYMPDPDLVEILLATYVANLMPGDAVWLLIVGPPSGGKTEPLMALTGLPHMYLASTLTEGALLSGTPSKDKAKGATGGLLRDIGDFGYLICKDFTSVLSIQQKVRMPILAALREIYDGKWDRPMGIDGGRVLSWKGKVALLAGCTDTIDNHHVVMTSMGQRFAFYRLPPIDAYQQAAHALNQNANEPEMRAALKSAVVDFL